MRFELYSDARPPAFRCYEKSPQELVMVYESSRGLHDLAQGLMEACFEYFKENITLTKKDLENDSVIKQVEFTLIKKG